MPDETDNTAFRGECPKEENMWWLIAEHTKRLWGDRICTLCGMRYKDHWHPWPETFATLVITCAGVPVKL